MKNENDDASWLVGGIVEKGFSQTKTMAPPRPSVLPFPMARHRSHGPHWAPKPKTSKTNDSDDDDDDGEEDDVIGMEMAADVANPVQRKEKKGLDFTHWKQIMKNGDKQKGMDITDLKTVKNSSSQNEDTSSNAKEQHMDVENVNSRIFTDMSCDNDNTESVMEDVRPVLQNGMSREIEMVSEMQHMPMNETASSFTKEGGSDLESQIDSENRALLSKMSPEEIAEARAELMKKLNPEFISVLKKRGQSKVTKQKFSLSDDTEADRLQREDNISKVIASSETRRSHKSEKIVDGDTSRTEGDKKLPNRIDKIGSPWDAWRSRVERVRDIRFSLDGSIVDTDSAPISDNCNVSTQSGYSADNVSQRDFLRTEGDPGAAGYTFKEAVALTRSVVPGQRALALSLIASLLDKAMTTICLSQGDVEGSVDWEAIWAFALGPEPELVLTLRMSLDDNHSSVVHACARAIQHVLSCEMNETIFNIFEKTPNHVTDVCTAPVFRSKPEITTGFLGGGFWKYNTKPSNIFPEFNEESMEEKPEDERTIQDDIVVAGQDIAAGLVRMGILPRICYILDSDPSAALEEWLISILIAIARHSPTCATEIVNCERLLQTVADRFALKGHMEINSCKIKSVKLFKVLARYDKKRCLTFIQNGFLHKVTLHLYRHPLSIDQWLKSGKESCKLSSALIVEQLRIWKVCIQYGYHLSDFSELFTSLCMWLKVPTFEKLIENGVVNEYCSITKEAYLLLENFARKLPNFYSYMEGNYITDQNEEALSWNQFAPIIDQAFEWIQLKRISCFSVPEESGRSVLSDSESSFLWIISSVLSMLSSLLQAVIHEDMTSLKWLPEFVSKLGLEIIKNGYLKFPETPLYGKGSLVEYLCHLRLENSQELAISSTCCLQGLVQVVSSIDKLIQHVNLDIHKDPSKFINLSREDKILANGLLKISEIELQDLQRNVMKLIMDEWRSIHTTESFNRGGPAPGVGVGWGAKNGGYWSLKTLLAKQDAILLNYLFEVSDISLAKNPSEKREIVSTFETLNSGLAACLIAGPDTNSVIVRLLNFIFQDSVLMNLNIGIAEFLRLRRGFKPFEWNYEKEEFVSFANVLASHFRERWLNVKKRKSDKNNEKTKGSRSLETIDEEPKMAEEPISLIQEWAHQRLHLPSHWFLSAISAVHFEKNMDLPSDFLEVARGGLYFLLGLEAIPIFIKSGSHSVVQYVPLIWKLHALSAVLLSGMGVLEDDKSRGIYETLQNLYGEILDENNLPLRFQADIHQLYSTFIDNLVDQFSAESYGDVTFGRQVAMYLHRSVEASVRLAAWNALSNARVLELLPPLDKCSMKSEGYLEPVEEDERILEAYVKSWVSGALDKAVARGSAASPMALHHLSSFIFGNVAGDMLTLRNKLVKTLLRDYSGKKQHEGMMVKLICYKKPDMTLQPVSEVVSSLPTTEINRRLQLLKEISRGNSSLLTAVEKLDSSIKRDFPEMVPLV